MHDTVRMERKGVPAVVLVHDRFEVAARAQSKIMGLPSTRIIVLPEGAPGEQMEQAQAKIDKVWGEIVEALVSAPVTSF